PGTVFHFLPGAYIDVGKENPGALIASGSDNLPIIFDSYDQDEYWGADEDGITGGIRIGKNADVKTELKYCKVNKATSGVYVDASVKVENCSFKNNREYGIVIDKNANPELISGNTYSNNGKDSLLIIQ
ncbi:MAG TPA: right-handed parallel beta-helix repeat-containing protein, partial [Chitinispirillaceae bacterium]|nr:right-handed parallel beta-helix repeat-containing protein [Chitinispirillaceae bacterium]